MDNSNTSQAPRGGCRIDEPDCQTRSQRREEGTEVIRREREKLPPPPTSLLSLSLHLSFPCEGDISYSEDVRGVRRGADKEEGQSRQTGLRPSFRSCENAKAEAQSGGGGVNCPLSLVLLYSSSLNLYLTPPPSGAAAGKMENGQWTFWGHAMPAAVPLRHTPSLPHTPLTLPPSFPSLSSRITSLLSIRSFAAWRDFYSLTTDRGARSGK